jgi:predicted ferric reductase
VSVAAATCVDANTASTAAILRGEGAVARLAGLACHSPCATMARRHRRRLAASRPATALMVIDLHGPGLWYATRAAGLVTLLLLTASVLLGVMTAGRFSSERWPRFLSVGLHRNLSLLVLVFLTLHVGTTVLDTFVSIPIIAVFVPFAASYKTFWLGLGTIASDLLLALLATSLLRNRLGYRSWRWVHWLAYACWPIGLAHGLRIGTDRATAWVFALTVACAAAVAAAASWRLVIAVRVGAR